MGRGGFAKRIFLSYAREDVAFAERLYRDLQSFGLNVWWDRRSILPGQDWDLAIRRAIESSEWFIALLSNNSVTKRGSVQREIRHALEVLEDFPEGSNYLIPVRIDNCEPTHERLKQRHWVDLFPRWEAGLGELLQAFGVDIASVESANTRLVKAMGLFRHALLGPVQGITSISRVLLKKLEELSPSDPVVRELEGRIKAEVELIRLLRENSRYVAYGGVDARRVVTEVTREVESVAERYRVTFANRRIDLQVVNIIDKSQKCMLEPHALDISLSNLLDNAAKYAFHGTSVSVKLSIVSSDLDISVEDLGHRPPEDVLASLNEASSTGTEDLSSWILDGKGLGLRVARGIAERHGGKLLSEVEEVNLRNSSELIPTGAYRVRFTIRLPMT